jgi:hypothetical protein
MTYDEYEEAVSKALDEWTDIAKRASLKKAAPSKQAAEDLIAEWKNSFPKRQARIHAFIRNYLDWARGKGRFRCMRDALLITASAGVRKAAAPLVQRPRGDVIGRAGCVESLQSSIPTLVPACLP